MSNKFFSNLLLSRNYLDKQIINQECITTKNIILDITICVYIHYKITYIDTCLCKLRSFSKLDKLISQKHHYFVYRHLRTRLEKQIRLSKLIIKTKELLRAELHARFSGGYQTSCQRRRNLPPPPTQEGLVNQLFGKDGKMIFFCIANERVISTELRFFFPDIYMYIYIYTYGRNTVQRLSTPPLSHMCGCPRNKRLDSYER